MSTREFFHSPTSVKMLQPGQAMAVTAKGKPSFIVTRAGKRPRLTLEELDRRAVKLRTRGNIVQAIIDQRKGG